MKISLLMSTYNGEKYILEQLGSLLNQTRLIDEVLIIDDKSTDQTTVLIKEFIDKNNLTDLWKVHINRQNKGWRQNFIDGVSMITGDIFFFCDQDDFWLKNKIEIMTDILVGAPQMQVLTGGEILWKGTGNQDIIIKSDRFSFVSLSSIKDHYLIQCSGCAMAVKTKYAWSVLPYYIIGWAHDDFFWKMAVTDGTLALMEDSTILHRIHGNNESRKKRTMKTTLQRLYLEVQIADQLLKYIEKDRLQITGVKDKKNIIAHKREGNLLRGKFLVEKKMRDLMTIIFYYTDIYRKKREIAGDVMLANNMIRNKN